MASGVGGMPERRSIATIGWALEIWSGGSSSGSSDLRHEVEVGARECGKVEGGNGAGSWISLSERERRMVVSGDLRFTFTCLSMQGSFAGCGT